MSIIDNLLVLLDNGKEKDISDIANIFNGYSKQVLSASLGRIVSKKWIVKKNSLYKITLLGQNINTTTLDTIKKFPKREDIKYCYFITFNISEKERIKRDIMRTYLNSHGFGRFHNTVWISFDLNNTELEKLINELDIKDRVLIFKAKIEEESINELIKHTSWNILKINTDYKEFIKHSQNFISTKSKNKIQARCLVYQFAKIVVEDPCLPVRTLSKKYLGFTAYKLYDKIRKYCY